MKRLLFSMLAMLVVFVLVIPAHATLINRGTDTAGNRLIYDDDLDITWYDFSNTADTWQNQVDWADALTVTFNTIDYSDWRLPTASSSRTTRTSTSTGWQFVPAMLPLCLSLRLLHYSESALRGWLAMA